MGSAGEVPQLTKVELRLRETVQLAERLLPGCRMTPWQQQWCTSENVGRYLAGRGGNTTAAAEILAKALTWREQFKAVLSGARTPCWQSDLRVLALGEGGHPIIYGSFQDNARGVGWKPAELIDHTAVVLEVWTHEMRHGADQGDIIFDCYGFRLAHNLNPRPTLALGRMVMQPFRDRLRTAIMVDPPSSFKVVWRIVEPCLSPATRSKVLFLSRKEAVLHIGRTSGTKAAERVDHIMGLIRSGAEGCRTVTFPSELRPAKEQKGMEVTHDRAPGGSSPGKAPHTLGYWSIFSIPALGAAGIAVGGAVSLALLPGFVLLLVPILEVLMGEGPHITYEDVEHLKHQTSFTYLLASYACLHLLLFPLACARFCDAAGLVEGSGILVSFSIMGSFALIVAHELCHHPEGSRFFTLGQAVHATQGKMHLPYEHNDLHHVRVGCADDTGTAKLGETVYGYMGRYFVTTFTAAWSNRVQHLGLRGAQLCFARNTALAVLAAVVVATWCGSPWALAFCLGQALLSVPLVASGNYIAHYGMSREGAPERLPRHMLTWDSYHTVGNYLLLNLPFHSCHHAYRGRPFQVNVLRSQAPTMPLPYTVSAILAFLPPVWFRLADPAVAKAMKEFALLYPAGGHSHRDVRLPQPPLEEGADHGSPAGTHIGTKVAPRRAGLSVARALGFTAA